MMARAARDRWARSASGTEMRKPTTTAITVRRRCSKVASLISWRWSRTHPHQMNESLFMADSGDLRPRVHSGAPRGCVADAAGDGVEVEGAHGPTRSVDDHDRVGTPGHDGVERLAQRRVDRHGGAVGPVLRH